MIHTLTTFATRHRWKVVLVWTVLGVGLTFIGQSLMFRATDSQMGTFLPKDYDSAIALRIAEDDFGVKPDAGTVTVLVARADGGPVAALDERAVGEVAAGLGRHRITMPASGDMPDVFLKDHSQTPVVAMGAKAPDGEFQLVTVSFTGNIHDPGLQDVYREFRALAKEEFAKAGMRTGFTGGIADVVDTADAEKTLNEVVGILTMGLIVLLNVLVFRSVAAALVPLLAVALVGGVASGAVVGVAMVLDVSLDPSTPSLISVVLIGIGIDYFLFLLFRFREHLRTHPGQDARTAAAATAGKVGTAITCAALTIVAAFATLGVASFGQFRVLGPAIAVSVLVMLLAALTLMPALLAVFGRGMFWPARAWKRDRGPGASARLGTRIARRPLRNLAAGLAVLGALTAGVLGMRMDYGLGGDPDTAAAHTAEEIARALPAGVSDPHTVYVRSTTGARVDPASLAGLTGALSGIDGIGAVGEPRLSERGTAARIDVQLTLEGDTEQARDLVSGPVRDAVARTTPEGTEAHVMGTAAVFADVSTAVGKDLRLVFPVAAALIALILFVLLRCVLAPLVLMIAVGLGFAATLGASTLVFQHTLDRPGVSFTLPLVLFLFVVALGTDYNILISDRIREEMEKPVPARGAVAEAVRHTAPAIATAGIVLAGSFASLGVNPDAGTQQIGFATGLGILLSAFVLSIVVVPAMAALLGRGIWWPTRSGRRRGAGPAEPGDHRHTEHPGDPERAYAPAQRHPHPHGHPGHRYPEHGWTDGPARR